LHPVQVQHEFKWIRSKANFDAAAMSYFTVQTASASLSRHERNWIKYLVLINLKYISLSEHLCYKFIVHACAETSLLLLFQLCRQEYRLQSFRMVNGRNTHWCGCIAFSIILLSTFTKGRIIKNPGRGEGVKIPKK
jgi:hypothetical protein